MSNQETKVFGIDLGTTYSCIAHVDEYGKPEVITNEEGERTTPSVILFESPDNIVVGKVAKESAVLSPDRVVAMVKRHMGEENWEFECDGLHYTPEEISSYILRKLAKDTEEKLGIPVKDVVITCPAYFGIAEREATANAGKIAGLNVREVINEPTAAAIVYGLQNEKDQVVLVYDSAAAPLISLSSKSSRAPLPSLPPAATTTSAARIGTPSLCNIWPNNG